MLNLYIYFFLYPVFRMFCKDVCGCVCLFFSQKLSSSFPSYVGWPSASGVLILVHSLWFSFLFCLVSAAVSSQASAICPLPLFCPYYFLFHSFYVFIFVRISPQFTPCFWIHFLPCYFSWLLPKSIFTVLLGFWVWVFLALLLMCHPFRIIMWPFELDLAFPHLFFFFLHHGGCVF